MARQPHPELNFGLGRGRLRTQRKAYSPRALLGLQKLLGLSDEEMKALLEKMRAEQSRG